VEKTASIAEKFSPPRLARPSLPPLTMMPRLLAIVLLLLSMAMLIPIITAALGLIRGAEVAPITWAVPLAILATGAFLTWLLTRRQVALQLYLLAFSLWVVTAGYFFVKYVM
jgi:hypothetical protein